MWEVMKSRRRREGKRPFPNIPSTKLDGSSNGWKSIQLDLFKSILCDCCHKKSKILEIQAECENISQETFCIFNLIHQHCWDSLSGCLILTSLFVNIFWLFEGTNRSFVVAGDNRWTQWLRSWKTRFSPTRQMVLLSSN